jgi:hypothetical protein
MPPTLGLPTMRPARQHSWFSRRHLATVGLMLVAAGLLVSIELSAAGLIFCVLGVLAFWLPAPPQR